MLHEVLPLSRMGAKNLLPQDADGGVLIHSLDAFALLLHIPFISEASISEVILVDQIIRVAVCKLLPGVAADNLNCAARIRLAYRGY